MVPCGGAEKIDSFHSINYFDRRKECGHVQGFEIRESEKRGELKEDERDGRGADRRYSIAKGGGSWP